MNDVTEGVSGLIYEGSVKSLLKNVTHGISNSAAKVTESLSDGLGRVIMDESHEEARQRIRANTEGSSDHLVAGLKGLGFGLLGGVTSIFKQSYDGAANEGFPVRAPLPCFYLLAMLQEKKMLMFLFLRVLWLDWERESLGLLQSLSLAFSISLQKRHQQFEKRVEGIITRIK